MSELYLIRHGRTEANEKWLYCGSTDLFLSEKGAEYLKGISDDKMIEYCCAIAAFRKTGLLHNDSFIKDIAEKFKFDSRATEELILLEAHERYNDVVKLLFCANPNKYIK